MSEDYTETLRSKLDGLPATKRQQILERVNVALGNEVGRLVDEAAQAVDADEQSALRNSYNEELARIPQGATRQIHLLKVKYRRLGLNIW